MTLELLSLKLWISISLHIETIGPQRRLYPQYSTTFMHLENNNTYVRMLFIDYIDSETPFSTKLSDFLTVDKVLFFFIHYYLITTY